MARETIQKVIDGKNYEFSQYGAKQGLKMLLRLSKIIGEPLAMGMSAFYGQGGKTESIKGDVLGRAVKALMSNAHEDEVLDLCTKFSSEDMLCDGKKIDFNSHYEGNFGLMFRVIQAALEVQYGNFFDALAELSSARAPSEEVPSAISNHAPTT